MFQGEYANTMDAKGRVSIPAAFRETLKQRYDSDCVIITRDYDGCIRVYPPKEWERVVLSEVRNKPIDDEWVRAFESFVVSPATACQPDKQGRILISQVLREHAKLNKKVIFSGGANHFEIWDGALREDKLMADLAILKKGRRSA
ncbi:MAG: division/cell wall cluster transcriptional repressor MraZ [Mariprofundaceae bacterium]